MFNNIDCEIIEMTCRQMGAKEIRRVDGALYYYEFEIVEGCDLSYFFDVNDKNEYNLHRIKPYRFSHTTIHSEKEVIAFIKADLARFRNAANSTNFRDFVATVNDVTAVGEGMDDMFLNFNVDRDALKDISDRLKGILAAIEKVKEESKAIALREE